MQIRGVELDFRLYDEDKADVKNRYFEEMKKMSEIKKEMPSGTVAEKNRYLCSRIKGMFDNVFGEGTGESVCGDGNDLLMHLDAYGQLVTEQIRQVSGSEIMSTLTDPFPESVTVSGVEYPIYADFRTVLRCFEIQGRKAELSEDDLLSMLRLFYNVKRMTATEDHIDQMFWFFSCGREKEKKKFPRKIAGINDKQPFDFEGDADLIYAGFIQQYGIDLQTEEMHWWKFMILLENLGGDTRF